MCQLSKRFGKYEQAQVVHHIFPRDEFPEYQYEAWNLISITTAMHMTLHDRTNGQLTDEGVKLLRRTARRQGIEVPLRYQ
jgi:5-methylcytosine-specific restriction enzyme A